MAAERPFKIVFVEDSPEDVEIMQIHLRESGIPFVMNVCDDGAKASQYFANGARESPPDLVLLDLRLPHKNGREVLQEIKSDPALRKIPVIVFSADPPQTSAFASFPNTRCLPKPFLMEEYEMVIGLIKSAAADAAKPQRESAQ